MPAKRMIIVAPNGARRSKADHPALPLSPDEIAREAARCAEAGASMIHLHARTSSGEHSLEIEDNRLVFDAVLREVGDRMLIQLTTEAVGRYQPQQQMQLIRTLKPQAASFALRELMADEQHLRSAAEFFHWCASEHILAQYILYSADDLQRYLLLRRRGLLPHDQHHLLFVLGRYSQNLQAQPSDLHPFTALADQLQVPWAVCAFGRQEQACLLHAARAGADLRIGFENNLLTTCGEPARDNAAQVEDLVAALDRIGYSPMSLAQTRNHLHPVETCGSKNSLMH